MRLSTLAAALAAAVLSVPALPAHALDRSPTISTPADCEAASRGGGADLGCEGSICWCCYSDGCYICDAQASEGSLDDCVWDSGASFSRVAPGLLNGAQPGLHVQPQTVPQTPPTIDLHQQGTAIGQ